MAVAISSCKKNNSSREIEEVVSEKSPISIEESDRNTVPTESVASVDLTNSSEEDIRKIYPYIKHDENRSSNPEYNKYRKEINAEMLKWKEAEHAFYFNLLTAYGDFGEYRTSSKEYYRKLMDDLARDYSHSTEKKSKKELNEVIKIKSEALMIMTNKASDLDIEGKLDAETLTKLESLNQDIQTIKGRLYNYSSYFTKQRKAEKERLDKLKDNGRGFNSEVDELLTNIDELYLSWNDKRKEISSKYSSAIGVDNNIEVNLLYVSGDKHSLFFEIYNAGNESTKVQELELTAKVQDVLYSFKINKRAFLASSKKEFKGLKLGDMEPYSSVILEARLSGGRVTSFSDLTYNLRRLAHSSVFGERLLTKESAHIAILENEPVFGDISTDLGVVHLSYGQSYSRTNEEHNLLIKEYAFWNEVLAEVKRDSQQKVKPNQEVLAKYTAELESLENEYEEEKQKYISKKL